MIQTSARRYVIIGSGVAGISAAQAIRAVDHSGEIHLISEDPYGFYSRPGLAYLLTGELGESNLYPFSVKELRELNLRWYKSQATCILSPEHRVELSDRSTLSYDRLLIATGSQAVPLSVPGANTQGIFKLDNMGDAQSILNECHRAKRAVVVGGGITAIEMVEGLLAQGLKVHFFFRGERYWNNVLDETESMIIEERLKNDGVQIHYKTELAEILSQKNHVTAVRTKDGRTIPCEMVAYAIGVQPRLELGRAAGLKIERGILTSEHLETSCQDIFAAGDVAQAYDPFTGKTVLDTLWAPAKIQGQISGSNMAGKTKVFRKSISFNVTHLAGLTTTIIGAVGRGSDPSLVGISRGDSETWRLLPDAVVSENRFDVNRLRLMIGEKHLLGAIVMGDQKLSRPLQELVDQRVDITPIREVLLRSNRPGDVISSFWVKWKEDRVL